MRNGAEETFHNQDTRFIGSGAAKASQGNEENTPRFFTAFFRFALPAVRSHRPPFAPQNRGVLCWCPLKTTPSRKPRRRSLDAKGDGNGTAIIKKKP